MDTTRGSPARYSSTSSSSHFSSDLQRASASSSTSSSYAASKPVSEGHHLPETTGESDSETEDGLPDDDQDASLTPNQPSRGTQTPSDANKPAVPIDELERFRSEWKQEVLSKGSRPAHRPSSRPPDVARQEAAQASSSSSTQPDKPSSSSDAPSEGNTHEQHNEAESDLSGAAEIAEVAPPPLPFPEAEIYAPAALKYSKGAHKVPFQPASSASELDDDLPAPSLTTEYHPAIPPDTHSSTHAASAPNTASSRFSQQVSASAIPFSSSTALGRPLAPKNSIWTEREAVSASSQSEASAGTSSSVARRNLNRSIAPAHDADTGQVGMKSAVEAYAHAVEMERGGQLDQALASYRRAFKLNSNADRLYHRAHLLLTDPILAKKSSHQNDALLSSPAVAEKIRRALDFDDHRYVAIKEQEMKAAEAKARGQVPESDPSKAVPAHADQTAVSASAHHPSHIYGSRPDELAKLFDQLSIDNGGERDFSSITFIPEDEERSMPISRLPDEILLHILRMIITPRGRRGAKIVKPKPTPEEQAAIEASAAMHRRGPAKVRAAASLNEKPNAVNGMSAVSSQGTQRDQEESASKPAGGVRSNREGAIAPAAAETEETAEPDSSNVVSRRRPLGIGVVLGGSDWQTLEIVGRTCWKFRLLTKSPSLWKQIVHVTYYPPILDPSITYQVLYERHHQDWRTVFVNQPRVRLNGCYIAACHYARPGMSEESAWIRVIHVVEFYRSIRFLPDGTALSLLTTDPPSETVRKLEPSLKAKGFSIGKWELFEYGLEDDEYEGRPKGPKVVIENLRDKSMQKYAFRMVFGLRSTTRGKWNKLDLLEYFSVNLTNGEVLPLPQKHSRPFHFSRVIPYGT